MRGNSNFVFPGFGTIAARINDREFVLSTVDGVFSCDDELTCVKVFDKPVQIAVSPSGKRLLVRDLKTVNLLLDTGTWRPIASYPTEEIGDGLNRSIRAIPGDRDIATEESGEVAIIHPDGGRLPLAGVQSISSGCCRYLNADLLAVKLAAPPSVAVFDSGGRERYRIPIAGSNAIVRTTIAPVCCDGSRFAIPQASYTLWNSIVNFSDIENNRPFDHFEVRLYESGTGREIKTFAFDPRPGHMHVDFSPDAKLIGTVSGSRVHIVSAR